MHTNMNNVLLLSDQHSGNTFLYKKLSARIPEFLSAYPPSDGYQIITSFVDMLSIKTGILDLIKTAIASGQDLSSCGITDINSLVNTMVCECKLLNQNGITISTRHASMELKQHKDLEILETASVQRLFASLGFGGEVFDNDELKDVSLSSLTMTETEYATSEGFDHSQPINQVEQTSKKDSDAQVPTDSIEIECSNKKQSQSVNLSVVKTEANIVPMSYQRQIQSLCSQLGEDVPMFDSFEHAKSILKDLTIRKKQQRQSN